jgi:DNA-binding NarL/FixJ family response regulator
MGTLRRYLGAPRSLAYGAAVGEEGAFLDFAEVSGFQGTAAEFRREMDQWIRTSSGRWALFNPTSPEPFQRDRVMAVGTLTELARTGRGGMLEADRLGLPPAERDRVLENLARGTEILWRWRLADDHQLRMLVCDGPALLAWVGVLQREPYTPRQLQRYRAIASALRARLVAESRVQMAPVYRAGLAAALEAIAGRAYLVAKSGRILHANAAGRSAFDRAPRDVADQLAAAIRGAPGAEVTRIESQGGGAFFLVLLRDRAGLGARADTARARYGLTRRQAEVLACVLRGHTNRRIAVELGCSERTVEIHMSNLFKKVNVGSRAALVSRVLHES